MRVPLQDYLRNGGSRVYSFVAEAPFSPVDVDLANLSRGEWNPLTDRFRIWYVPGDGPQSAGVCYVMVRKFDRRDETLTVAHIVVNLRSSENESVFTVGILSNDDVRARTLLNATLGIPPAFHRRSELKLVERRWRNDPEAVFRFVANVHSVMAGAEALKGGAAYKLSFELPPGIRDEFKRGLGSWWSPTPGPGPQSETRGARK